MKHRALYEDIVRQEKSHLPGMAASNKPRLIMEVARLLKSPHDVPCKPAGGHMHCCLMAEAICHLTRYPAPKHNTMAQLQWRVKVIHRVFEVCKPSKGVIKVSKLLFGVSKGKDGGPASGYIIWTALLSSVCRLHTSHMASTPLHIFCHMRYQFAACSQCCRICLWNFCHPHQSAVEQCLH